jgi:hypothetical protein
VEGIPAQKYHPRKIQSGVKKRPNMIFSRRVYLIINSHPIDLNMYERKKHYNRGICRLSAAWYPVCNDLEGVIPRFYLQKKPETPGKRFELLRCRAPLVFKTNAFPD